MSPSATIHCVISSQWIRPDEVMVKSSVIVFLLSSPDTNISSVETVSAYEWLKNVKKSLKIVKNCLKLFKIV